MDVPDDDWAAYLNRRTGELVTITGEEGGSSMMPMPTTMKSSNLKTSAST